MRGLLGNSEIENKEEEKKEVFTNKSSKFKNVHAKLKFTPEEIIMFYVQPSDIIKTRFNDWWIRVSDARIKKGRKRYTDHI